MSVPMWCVLAAFALTLLARAPVAITLGTASEAELEGWRRRLVAAHRALVDGFAPFAAAVIITQLSGADPRRSAVLAIAFVVTEVLYVAAHVGNADYLRAFVWLIGLFAVLGLFGLAAAA